MITGFFIAALLGLFAAAFAQLPSKIMADKHLIHAEQLYAAKDYANAFKEMQKILALQKEHIEGNASIELHINQNLSPPSPPSSLPTDFNSDGLVDFSDFVQLVGHFGTKRDEKTYQSKYDLNSDGTVEFSDFLIFTGTFGQAGPVERHKTFNIDLVFVDENFMPNQKNVVRSAAKRWESIIVEDLPDVDYSIYPFEREMHI